MFEIRLPRFEGPFDLLLFFIERDELDIHDIPIATITNDFLEYVRQLEALNLDVASEFVLVAATLMRIKVRMLLPRPVDPNEPEADPRAELARHLLEYKRYKSVLGELAALEADRAARHPRAQAPTELRRLAETLGVEAELQHLDLYRLMRVYQRTLDRFEARQAAPTHQVTPYPMTVAEQKNYVLSVLKRPGGRCAFADLLDPLPTRMAAVFNFLAILELLQSRLITLRLGEGYNDFWIEAIEPVTTA